MDYSLLVGIHFLQHEANDSGSEGDDSDEGGPSPPLNKSMATLPPLVPQETIPPPLTALSVFEREEGGIGAKEPDGSMFPEYYYIGIIDILMLYSARKQIEHIAKRALHPTGEISSVNPSEFAERFVRFVSESVD